MNLHKYIIRKSLFWSGISCGIVVVLFLQLGITVSTVISQSHSKRQPQTTNMEITNPQIINHKFPGTHPIIINTVARRRDNRPSLQIHRRYTGNAIECRRPVTIITAQPPLLPPPHPVTMVTGSGETKPNS